MNSIYKLLAYNPKYNPFSLKFDDNEVLRQIHSQTSSNNAHKEAVEILQGVILLNKIVNKIFTDASDSINLYSQGLTNGLQVLLVTANLRFIITQYNANKQLRDKPVATMQELYHHRIDAILNDQKEPSPIVTQLEYQSSAIHHIANILPHLSGDGEEQREFTAVVSSVIEMFAGYDVLKENYEQIVFHEGIINVDDDNKIVLLSHRDYEKEILVKIGLFRYLRQLHASESVLKSNIIEDKITDNNYIKLFNFKRVKSIDFDEFGFVATYSKGRDKLEIEHFAKNYAGFDILYPFLIYEKPPINAAISIIHIIAVRSAISALILRVLGQFHEKGQLKDPELLDFRSSGFNKDRLLGYLYTKLKIQKSHVRHIVELFTEKYDKRRNLNLWNGKLIEIGGILYFEAFSFVYTISPKLADEWLESSGFDLTGRGKMFETFAREEITNAFRKRGFKYELWSSYKIGLHKVVEEIDLILLLNGVILLFELKCMKFPINPRMEENNRKTVRKAVGQIQRKAQHFKNAIRTDKNFLKFKGYEVEGFVCCNIPHYSGLKSHGVAVIDVSMLINYIKDGKLSRNMLVENGKIRKKGFSPDILYYTDEQSFSENIVSVLANFPAIERLKKQYSITTGFRLEYEGEYTVESNDAMFNPQKP